MPKCKPPIKGLVAVLRKSEMTKRFHIWDFLVVDRCTGQIMGTFVFKGHARSFAAVINEKLERDHAKV